MWVGGSVEIGMWGFLQPPLYCLCILVTTDGRARLVSSYARERRWPLRKSEKLWWTHTEAVFLFQGRRKEKRSEKNPSAEKGSQHPFAIQLPWQGGDENTRHTRPLKLSPGILSFSSNLFFVRAKRALIVFFFFGLLPRVSVWGGGHLPFYPPS